MVSGEIGAYLGVPLRGPNGQTIGALCVIDPIGRVLDDEDTRRLQRFVPIIEDQLDQLRQADADDRNAAAVAADAGPSGLGAVVPWFRPIVGLSSHRILGFDALARREGSDGRTTDPRRRLISRPDQLVELDLTVAGRAMTVVRRWQEHDPQLSVNVNIAAPIIARPDCVATLTQLAVQAGIRPVQVNITLQEPPAWAATDSAALATVKSLRDRGFGIFRDEFGTAWAGLDQLLWFPGDAVRLDPALTAALGTDVGDKLIRAVTEVAHALEQRVVIDGIGSFDQARSAASLGCDRALGDLWGTAQPESAIDQRYRPEPVGAQRSGVG